MKYQIIHAVSQLSASLLLTLLILGFSLSSTATENEFSIKVGVYENPPKLFTNSDGEPDGIFIDVLTDIAQQENIQIQYVHHNWNVLFEMLKTGEIDLLPDVAYSAQRDSLFTFNTLPILSSWVEVFTRVDNPITSLSELNQRRMGVLQGSIQENFLLNEFRPIFELNIILIPYNSYSEMSEALKAGKVDALMATRFFYFNDFVDSEVLPTGIIFLPGDLFFAFRKDIEPQLVTKFDRHISQLKNNQHSVFYKSLQRWLGKDYKKGSYAMFIGLIGVVSVGLLVVSIFALLLRYSVKRKTKELVRNNLELQKAKEKAEESEKLKTVFLHNISHEIRTPMNGILGFLELLREPDVDSESVNEYLEIMNKSGIRLINTINDIVEISEIQSGQVNVKLEAVDICNILDNFAQKWRKEAHRKGLEFRVNQQIAGTNSICIMDLSLFNTAFSHIVGNAVKFTSGGSIEIGYYDENNFVVFYVKDTGIGIPDDKISQIFERFASADISSHRTHEGLGVGLAIARAYVELQKGTLWVHSEPDKGSTFYISLPLNV